MDLETGCFRYVTLLVGGRIGSFQIVIVVDGEHSLFLDSLIALDRSKLTGFKNSGLPPTRQYCLNIRISFRD